jgi:hypothetical protein
MVPKGNQHISNAIFNYPIVNINPYPEGGATGIDPGTDDGTSHFRA